MLDDVKDALRRHATGEALTKARDAVQAQPGNAEAHHLLGLALQAQGNSGEAHQSFDQAIALAPDNAAYQVSRAGLLLGEGDREQAQQALDKAIAIDPNQVAAYIMASHLALTRDDLTEAERLLKRAALVNPNHPHTIVTLGQLETRRGNHDEALKLYNDAFAAAPDDTLVLSALAHAYLARGNAAFAEQTYRRALLGDPRQVALRRGLFEALRAQNRMEDAALELVQLRRDLPDDIGLLQLSGEFALYEGQIDDALRAFRGVLEQQPRSPRALTGAMRIWQGEHQEQQGRVVLDGLLERDPQAENAWEARFALEVGQSDASRAVLERWLVAMPESAAALEISAQIQEAEGNFAEAEALADRAMVQPTLRLAAELVKARAQLHSDPEAAIKRLEYLAGVVTSKAHKRAVLGWLGYACDRAGHLAQAIDVWEQAQALDDDTLGLPVLGDIDDQLERATESARAASNEVKEPPAILLWGPPGSGVERVAAILRTQPEFPLLDDRMHQTVRRDGFQTGDFSHLINPDREVAAAEAFASYWRSGVADMGYAGVTVIDWLRRWDARLAPAVRRALPGSVLVVAMRDPRDMLLNWIAYGSPSRFAFPGVLAASNWLAMSLEHLGWLSDHPLFNLCLLQVDDIDDGAPHVAEQLQRFLRLNETPSTSLSDRLKLAQGGHPSRLPAGHWREYRDVLAEAFKRLTPIAERLGYPVE
ncbi:MAG: tetratricopeptide repeat protein [Lysobacteraceae bacterium]